MTSTTCRSNELESIESTILRTTRTSNRASSSKRPIGRAPEAEAEWNLFLQRFTAEGHSTAAPWEVLPAMRGNPDVLCVSHHQCVDDQGLGFAAFNELPMRKAVHAVMNAATACRWPAIWPGDGPTPTQGVVPEGRRIVVLALEPSIDDILQAYPKVGSRLGASACRAVRARDER